MPKTATITLAPAPGPAEAPVATHLHADVDAWLAAQPPDPALVEAAAAMRESAADAGELRRRIEAASARLRAVDAELMAAQGKARADLITARLHLDVSWPGRSAGGAWRCWRSWTGSGSWRPPRSAGSRPNPARPSMLGSTPSSALSFGTTRPTPPSA